jgi:DNA-binding NtrC family response regulator
MIGTAAAGAAPAGPRLSACRVLLVEDDRITRELLERLTAATGVKACVTVRSAEEAWTTLTGPGATVFHVLITDLTLPGVSGKALLAHLRRSKARYLTTLPVVVLTGSNDLETYQSVAPYGIAAFLIKPVSSDLIAAAIARALDGETTIDHLSQAALGSR